MNALASPTRARWEDFRPTVRAIFPAAPAEELELRARLLLIRDLTIAALGYSSEEAWHLLKAIADMASRYALEPLTLDQLREMRRILVLTSTCANSMQVLMNDIHHGPEPEAVVGGEGARG